MDDLIERTIGPAEPSVSSHMEVGDEIKKDIVSLGDKQKKVTPDFPTVPYKTCLEYRRYVESGHMDDNSTARHNPAPEDSLKLSDLGRMSDGEILRILNQMAVTPQKSDVRIMYAHGYGFTWTQLTVVASFKGYEIENPGCNKPHFVVNNVDGLAGPIDEVDEDGIIYIQHGKRDTIDRKYTLSREIVEKIDHLFDGLVHLEKSKAVEALISEAVEKYSRYKEKGLFHVAYRPTKMEILL